LRSNGGFSGSGEVLYLAFKDKMSYCKMMLILQIMKSERLISASLHCADVNIKLLPVAEKIDIENSQLLQSFKDQI